MWVYEEMIDGTPLTKIINTKHENVKYLPGIKLPESVLAVPDLIEAVRGATVLVFVVPHQFVPGICKQLESHISPEVKAISLIKGVDVNVKGLQLISQLIHSSLGVDVSVLMGANIASEVAEERFCETTIGYNVLSHGEMFKRLFQTRWFRVAIVNDVCGVEVCGALKNVVAIAAGIVDGLEYGSNTKAAIIRIGLMEMKQFAELFYHGVKPSTFFESCGVADLITTCLGGRNRKVAEAFARTRKPFDQLEAELLNGQMLQGTSTAREVHEILKAKNLVDEFPLFTCVYKICYESYPPEHVIENL